MPVWIALKPALCFVSCVFSFHFFFLWATAGDSGYYTWIVADFSYFFVPLSLQWVPYTVYGTHKYHFSTIFSLKIGLTILFTHLKIILLQCFQFQFFSFSNNKFNPNRPIDRLPSKLNDKLTLVHKYKQWSWRFLLQFSCYFCFFFLLLFIQARFISYNGDDGQLGMTWLH